MHRRRKSLPSSSRDPFLTSPNLQLKAPAETPYSVLAIAELARQAGVPAGVINVIVTHKHVSDVGLELCSNPLVRSILLLPSCTADACNSRSTRCPSLDPLELERS